MTVNARNVLTNDVAIAKIGSIFKNFSEGIYEVLKQNIDSKNYFDSRSKEDVNKNKSKTSDTVDSSPSENVVNDRSISEKNLVIEESAAKTNGEEKQQKVACSISDLIQQVEKNKAVEHLKSSKVAVVAADVAKDSNATVQEVKPVNQK